MAISERMREVGWLEWCGRVTSISAVIATLTSRACQFCTHRQQYNSAVSTCRPLMRSTPEELTLASPLKWNLPPMDCERSLVVPNQQRSHHSLARTGRVHRWLAGAACVCAFALPFTVAWVKDGTAESRASLTAESTVSRPAIARLPQQTGSNHAVDAAHAASMMLVGTLLIGVGSVVRRGL